MPKFGQTVNKTFWSCKSNHQKQFSKHWIWIVNKYCNPRFKREASTLGWNWKHQQKCNLNPTLFIYFIFSASFL